MGAVTRTTGDGPSAGSPLRNAARLLPMTRAMASKALREWRTSAAAVLDEIDRAHGAVGGPKHGRRVATLRLTHAYVLLLSAQFQRFCRDLHSEAFAWALGRHVAHVLFAELLLDVATSHRALDRGNPTPTNIVRDFRQICPQLRRSLAHADRHNEQRRRSLETLNAWRNAIAHHDFTRLDTANGNLSLSTVRTWRRACGGLATSLDAVIAESLRHLVGRSPW